VSSCPSLSFPASAGGSKPGLGDAGRRPARPPGHIRRGACRRRARPRRVRLARVRIPPRVCSRLGGQAGTQAPDATPYPVKTAEAGPEALSTVSPPTLSSSLCSEMRWPRGTYQPVLGLAALRRGCPQDRCQRPCRGPNGFAGWRGGLRIPGSRVGRAAARTLGAVPMAAGVPAGLTAAGTQIRRGIISDGSRWDLVL
jgi:hypothetical protein